MRLNLVVTRESLRPLWRTSLEGFQFIAVKHHPLVRSVEVCNETFCTGEMTILHYSCKSPDHLAVAWPGTIAAFLHRQQTGKCVRKETRRSLLYPRLEGIAHFLIRLHTQH